MDHYPRFHYSEVCILYMVYCIPYYGIHCRFYTSYGIDCQKTKVKTAKNGEMRSTPKKSKTVKDFFAKLFKKNNISKNNFLLYVFYKKHIYNKPITTFI